MMFDIRCKHPVDLICADYVEPTEYFDAASGEICYHGGGIFYFCRRCSAEIEKADLPQAYLDSLAAIVSLDTPDLPI